MTAGPGTSRAAPRGARPAAAPARPSRPARPGEIRRPAHARPSAVPAPRAGRAGTPAGSRWPASPGAWLDRGPCLLRSCTSCSQTLWPTSSASALPSRCPRQIDQISGAYRSTSASRACSSAFVARATRSVTSGSSRTGSAPVRLSARELRLACPAAPVLPGMRHRSRRPCRGAACLSGHDLVLLPSWNWPGSPGCRLVPLSPKARSSPHVRLDDEQAASLAASAALRSKPQVLHVRSPGSALAVEDAGAAPGSELVVEYRRSRRPTCPVQPPGPRGRPRQRAVGLALRSRRAVVHLIRVTARGTCRRP